MNITFSILAKCVPAICIVCGFIAVYGFEAGSGWFFVIIGVALQVLYLYFNRRS